MPHGETYEGHILFAEQCSRVSVAQTPSALYVFYEKIMLTSFGNFGNKDPRPVLCDLAEPSCIAVRDQLVERGTTLVNICPHRPTKGDVK